MTICLCTLFEPPPVPAGKKRIAPEKIAEHHAKTEHRQHRGFLATQSRGDPSVQQRAVQKPRAGGGNLPRIPRPVITPVNTRPEAAGDDAERHQREAPEEQPIVEPVERLQRWKSFHQTGQVLVLESSLLKAI